MLPTRGRPPPGVAGHDVEAGAEVAPGAGEHDHPDVLVPPGRVDGVDQAATTTSSSALRLAGRSSVRRSTVPSSSRQPLDRAVTARR